MLPLLLPVCPHADEMGWDGRIVLLLFKLLFATKKKWRRKGVQSEAEKKTLPLLLLRQGLHEIERKRRERRERILRHSTD